MAWGLGSGSCKMAVVVWDIGVLGLDFAVTLLVEFTGYIL